MNVTAMTNLPTVITEHKQLVTPIDTNGEATKQHMPQNRQSTLYVSFRDDVTFEGGGVSARSLLSMSSNSNSNSDEVHSSSNPNPRKYMKLRSSLMREQNDRDPLFFYQVVRNLGSGSMGDVKLVKKRQDKIGGSARRDLQEAVKRQKQDQACLEIPVLGKLFRLCIDGDLKDHNQSNAFVNSRHSVISLLSQAASTAQNDQATAPTGSVTARTFEDSLFSTKSSASGTKQSLCDIVYAMKSIHLDQVNEKVFVDELRNEISILKDLDHPNIVRAIETFEFQSKISIVMEVCSGGDLYSRDPYTELRAARIVSSILSAIAYMHSHRIVHRDLKYENVLFVNTSPMSDVKLIDFGLSRVYVDDGKFTDIAGTIYTMAPEVINGAGSDEKADMWSVGVITYMLLSSSLPFYGKSRQEVAARILNKRASFKSKRWSKISSKAKEFIKRLLVQDPIKRLDAQDTLGCVWLNQYLCEDNEEATRLPHAQEEALAQAAMKQYAQYPKLKKMALMVVAHKSSSDEIGILRRLFDMYSTHDGSISREHFTTAMSTHSSEMDADTAGVVFDGMDFTGTGHVHYTEFIAATLEAHGAISEARLAEAFDRLDCDDSGYITQTDLQEILGDDFPIAEIKQMIAEADSTSNGSVSYSDFISLWENQPNLLARSDSQMRVLECELSSISFDSSSSSKVEEIAAQAFFLKQKHLQNTLHTWALEMQLPAQEFAKGCSFLHRVALGNRADLAEVLETRPALVNFRDYDRRTPLHVAASEGLVEICELLIQKGSRVNRSDRWGGSPLDDAHRHGQTAVVNLLREHGARFGSTSQTVNLITAASEGNVEEVQALIEFGSLDLNQGDYDGRRALHLAAHEGHLEVVQLLCSAGADINVKDRWGDRPIDDARKAKANSEDIIDVLAGHVTGKSEREPVPTMHDLKDQKPKKVHSVREKGDDGMTQLSIQEFSMGCSFLHQCAMGEKIVIEMALLEKPELVHFKDYDLRTPLHIAASEGQLEICKHLAEKGAKLNRVDRWGGSALDDAYRQKHMEVFKYLRGIGARFGSTSQVTNFISAASEGDVDEVKSFLEFGSIDINQGDYDKRTALHLATGEGHLEVLRILCNAGADVNVEDRWGHRPLDDAKKFPGIAKLLLQHGAKSKNFITNIFMAFVALKVGN